MFIIFIFILFYIAVDLLTEHIGRSFYFPSGRTPTYPTLDKAKKACLVLERCTGVLEIENKFTVHTGMELYNTRDKKVKTWIKSGIQYSVLRYLSFYLCLLRFSFGILIEQLPAILLVLISATSLGLCLNLTKSSL